VLDFAERVAQYYTPYVAYALMYLGIAWVVYGAVKSMVIKNQTA
jgi:cation transport ATPase